MVRQPAFPEDRLAKLVKQTRTGLAIQERSPDYIAQRQLLARVYGAHPYARTPGGESADLDRLTVADLRSWWAKHVRPDAAILYVAGLQSYLLGSFPGRRETAEARVRDLWLVESEGLPTDHYQRYLKAVARTTVADVHAAAQTLIHEDALTIVVVGQASALEPQLRAIAPVELVK